MPRRERDLSQYLQRRMQTALFMKLGCMEGAMWLELKRVPDGGVCWWWVDERSDEESEEMEDEEVVDGRGLERGELRMGRRVGSGSGKVPPVADGEENCIWPMVMVRSSAVVVAVVVVVEDDEVASSAGCGGSSVCPNANAETGTACEDVVPVGESERSESEMGEGDSGDG